MIVLASNSPRRKQLMAKITTEFCVVPSTAKEVTTAVTPHDAARELACHKALDVLARLPAEQRAQATVVGCDTVVDVDNTVLGKPADEKEAGRMLHMLSDRTHKVHTGYCVASLDGIAVGVATTDVTFRKLTDKDIDDYVASGGPMDKAGAYGIQETDFVASIDGSYDNVMGLPTETLAKLLKK